MRIVWHRYLDKFANVYSAHSSRGVAITPVSLAMDSALDCEHPIHLLSSFCGYYKTLNTTVAILTVSSLFSHCDKIP